MICSGGSCSTGEVHLYENHIDQANELLSRDPRPLPTLKLNPVVSDIEHFKYEDIEIQNYNPHPSIKAPVAI